MREDTAAVIVEPVQGVAGAFDLGAEFLTALRRRCDESGALLIFDEVQCGVGRTGYPFAANLYGVLPDMITTAKALGNGFPCAALLMSARVAQALTLDSLGTTFGGGPMACAAIEAVIDAIESRAAARARAARRRLHPRNLHRGSGHRASRRGISHRPRDANAGQAGTRSAARARHSHRHGKRPADRAPAAALHPRRSSTSIGCATRSWRSRPEPRASHETLRRSRRFLARGRHGAAAACAPSAKPPRAARARRQDPRPALLQSLAAYTRLVSGGDGAPRRQLVCDYRGRRQLAPGDAQRRRDGRRCGRACTRGHSGARLLLRCARDPRLRRRQ